MVFLFVLCIVSDETNSDFEKSNVAKALEAQEHNAANFEP